MKYDSTRMWLKIKKERDKNNLNKNSHFQLTFSSLSTILKSGEERGSRKLEQAVNQKTKMWETQQCKSNCSEHTPKKDLIKWTWADLKGKLTTPNTSISFCIILLFDNRCKQHGSIVVKPDNAIEHQSKIWIVHFSCDIFLNVHRFYFIYY